MTSGYQLLSLTAAALEFLVVDVAEKNWTISFLPLLDREDLKQPLAARVH